MTNDKLIKCSLNLQLILTRDFVGIFDNLQV